MGSGSPRRYITLSLDLAVLNHNLTVIVFRNADTTTLNVVQRPLNRSRYSYAATELSLKYCLCGKSVPLVREASLCRWRLLVWSVSLRDMRELRKKMDEVFIAFGIGLRRLK